MERHANYALVGVLTTILLIVGLVFAVWLGGLHGSRDQDLYRIVFQGPVRGLTQGGEVQFNGIKVGQIQRIQLSERDPTQVLTDIEVSAGTPVRVDSLASTEMQGISGVNVVQISAGTTAKPLLRDVAGTGRPLIRSKANALSALLQGGGQMVSNATEALDRVNRLLSDRNIAALSAAVEDMRQVAGELAANRAMIGNAASALAKLDAAATDVQATAASVRGIADGDGKRAVAEIASAATELKQTLGEARAVIAGFGAQRGTLEATTLPTINATMQSLQETSDTLDGLIRQFRQNPRATLGRDRGKELELPK